MEQAEIKQIFDSLESERKRQGKTYNLKETDHILNFLKDLGEKGVNMAYTFYDYIEKIENDSPPDKFDNFIEENSLNDYYTELKIFINACQYGQEDYEHLEKEQKEAIRTKKKND